MNEKILDALEDMYIQYCDCGHRFMSAGETALEVLQLHGKLKDYDVEANGSLTAIRDGKKYE